MIRPDAYALKCGLEGLWVEPMNSVTTAAILIDVGIPLPNRSTEGIQEVIQGQPDKQIRIPAALSIFLVSHRQPDIKKLNRVQHAGWPDEESRQFQEALTAASKVRAEGPVLRLRLENAHVCVAPKDPQEWPRKAKPFAYIAMKTTAQPQHTADKAQATATKPSWKISSSRNKGGGRKRTTNQAGLHG